MKNKKIYFTIFAIIFWIILFSNKSFAGSQKWNRLDYDVTLDENGNMDVVEIWDIHVSDTNTLFKDFNLDESKFSEITNVSVTEISPNRVEYNQIYQEQYHVSPQCFYAMKLSSDFNTFEIAWNVGFDNSSGSKTYKISYTIKDAVKVYGDCTELYWMFLDTTNTIPASKVTGKVKLPKPVNDIEKLRVWGHGPLNATIEKESEDTIKFECNNFDASTMLEIRVVTEENIYSDVKNKKNIECLNSILEEEEKWANEANNKRNKSKFINFLLCVFFLILNIFWFNKVRKYLNERNTLKMKYTRYVENLQYFREIPNEENATPTRAAYLMNLNSTTAYLEPAIPQLFSATMLDLALKGYIDFEPIDDKEFKIIIKNNSILGLSSDEKAFFDILIRAAGSDNTITTKEFTKYTKRNYEELHNIFEMIPKMAKNYHEKQNNIDKERLEIRKTWSNKGIEYFLVIFIMIFITIFMVQFIFIFGGGLLVKILAVGVVVTPIILGIICFSNAKLVSVLSDKGAEEQQQWKGLKNYMRDFSLLKEKNIPDIVLWEKFLVYATAFGISKEVIKQLKVVYPELSNQDNYNNHNNRRHSYMYYMCDSRFGDNFFNTFNNAMTEAVRSSQNAYNSAHSSGSGGGGGFSSGGGGGRRWWPELVADKK